MPGGPQNLDLPSARCTNDAPTSNQQRNKKKQPVGAQKQCSSTYMPNKQRGLRGTQPSHQKPTAFSFSSKSVEGRRENRRRRRSATTGSGQPAALPPAVQVLQAPDRYKVRSCTSRGSLKAASSYIAPGTRGPKDHHQDKSQRRHGCIAPAFSIGSSESDGSRQRT